MVLGVDATTVVNAINSKIGTMTRALKFNSQASKPVDEPRINQKTIS